jgi:hypothetical protein
MSYNIKSIKKKGAGKVIKERSQKGLRAVTHIYNTILQNEYFPCQLKVGQIILTAKPGKYPNDITSYRPISLLPTLSQILEKIFLKRLTPILDERKLILLTDLDLERNTEPSNKHTDQSIKSTTIWKANATSQLLSST